MARIFKRRDVWFCWVPKPGGGTRRVSTGCTDKRAAESRAVELEREAASPANAAASKATTADACDDYVRSRMSRGRASATIDFYKVKLGHAVRLLPTRLNDVDAIACERFIAKRKAEGAKNAIKKEMGAIRSVLRHARRMGIYKGVVEEVIPELEDSYEPRSRFLLPLELVALVNALSPERAAHVVFIVATGARWGESERARRGDVKGVMVHLRGTKTKRSQGMVPVPPPMRGPLAWALARSKDDLLFARWGNVRRDLAMACEQIGIEPVTPNDLRRTFGSWLRIAGVSTDLIGSMMRHTDSRMAERVYGRINPADLNALISGMMPAIDTGTSLPGPHPRGLLMGCDTVPMGSSGSGSVTPDSHEAARFPVPGDGIEPPTRGFSIPADARGLPEKVADSADSRAANGLAFGARARRWLMREAA